MFAKLSTSILVIIVLVQGIILTKLIYFPYPELFVYPYLTNNGLKPYQQIFDQHFPGLLFLPVNFNNLGMSTSGVARVWSIALVLIIQILLFIIGKKMFGSSSKALLVNFLYMVWQPFFEGWVLWIDNFLPLFLLPAFYSLYTRKYLLAGFLLGVSIVFKQVLIPLSILSFIYIILKERHLKGSFLFLLGVIFPIALMLVYLSSIGVLKDFWYWTVTFNLTTYAQFGRGEGPTFAHFYRVIFVFGSAFTLIALDKLRTRQTTLLIIFLIGTLLGLSTRFDFVHFQPALPFALLATIYGMWRLRRLWQLGMIGVYGLVLIYWSIIFYKGHLGTRVISFDTDTLSLAAKIKSYTSPKEKIFVFGAAPHLYQMSNTLPAGDVFVFQFPWFLKVSQEKILEGIKRDKPEIVVSDRLAVVEGVKISDFAKEIDEYISRNYRRIDSVNKTEILRKITP